MLVAICVQHITVASPSSMHGGPTGLTQGTPVRKPSLASAARHLHKPTLHAAQTRSDTQNGWYACMQAFVVAVGGGALTAPVDMTVAAVFCQSTPGTPIVLLISPGSDPAADILELAGTSGRGGAGGVVPPERRSGSAANVQKVTMISLGRGQSAVAEAAIDEGVERGHWVRPVSANTHTCTNHRASATCHRFEGRKIRMRFTAEGHGREIALAC